MKAVILAGGLGTRISEETSIKPKPMIEIGGKPILWHIMKCYSTHGVTEFIVCCGYRGYIMKEYFANYFLHQSDVTIDLEHNTFETHNKKAEPWKITLVDTGESSQTGGRLKRVRQYLGEDDFCMTYGDGLSSVDISSQIKFHKSHGKLATMTTVRPPGRFGVVEVAGTSVSTFDEKPSVEGSWINGGFFILNPKVMDLIEGDSTIWEAFPLKSLVKNSQLEAFTHLGFWQPMDTLRDKILLEEMWASGRAPWKNWSD